VIREINDAARTDWSAIPRRHDPDQMLQKCEAFAPKSTPP
jgi:hypothetical protein